MLHRLPEPKVDPERKRAHELREAYVRPVHIAAHTSDTTALTSFRKMTVSSSEEPAARHPPCLSRGTSSRFAQRPPLRGTQALAGSQSLLVVRAGSLQTPRASITI